VISRQDETLVGYVGWKDLMRVRLKLRAEEQERSSFLGGIMRRPAKADAEG
jgi:hypothetical protein